MIFQPQRKGGFMARTISRRQLLVSSGIATASLSIVPRSVLGRGLVPPSDKVNIAIIGTGGQGIVNIKALFGQPDARVIAIADPNEESDYSRFYYGGTAGRGPALRLIQQHREATGENGECAAYLDYREMLDKEKDADAVLVATPDHVHAVATMAAINLGKHVYCEKPLTHTVYEARKLTEAAREAGVATQMGNQGHSGEGIRQTCEWIWDGAIGPVREVHAWTGASGWAEGDRPTETPPVPETFDWDLWLGPIPYRPYHPAYAPYNWRGWWAFGTGSIGDMACHNIDPAFWALKLGHPTTVEAIDAEIHPEIVPAESTVHYEFPAREDLPPVTLTWYDGRRRPTRPEGMGANEQLEGNGIIFVGEKGSILCGGWGGAPRLLPSSLAESYRAPSPTLPRSDGHHRDWLDACKGDALPSSNFNYAGPLTEVVLLGNVAQRSKGKLEWDGRHMTVTNNAEANQFVQATYRGGWRL
jgi:predicted dehydrogenase